MYLWFHYGFNTLWVYTQMQLSLRTKQFPESETHLLLTLMKNNPCIHNTKMTIFACWGDKPHIYLCPNFNMPPRKRPRNVYSNYSIIGLYFVEFLFRFQILIIIIKFFMTHFNFIRVNSQWQIGKGEYKSTLILFSHMKNRNSSGRRSNL